MLLAARQIQFEKYWEEQHSPEEYYFRRITREKPGGDMRRSFLLVPVILALSAMAWDQISSEPGSSGGQVAPQPAPNSTTATDMFPPATVLSIALSNGLDVRRCKVNDKIEARTAADLFVHGESIAPQNTKIVGHIADVKAQSKSSPGSTVAIVFDRMLLKGGREVALPVTTIQAIAGPLHKPSYQSGPDAISGRSMTPDRMAPVGAQAPAGQSSSLPPDYVDNVPAPPSINAGGPNRSTISPLNPMSQGFVGLKGLSLDTSGPVSVLSSSRGNVHLESGTQLILRVR